ncbi:HD domain-containing phosphohydrolase [Desulfuromonas thiophila]|uniref:HD domain-containing phosphohydrolase n=1 Tax=Desulfuromonas thiophila TaxID=57664 RepID=UPI0029F5A1F8|nr:HD domain-containing phosphohydrolase [Desulfuromonas thiophila]
MNRHPAAPPQATVLVVDDASENLTVMGEILQESYRVRVANSGPRALQVVQSTPRPDLILLDVIMPQMDGYAVLRALQANSATADIPVIFVTAMDSDADEERGLALGAVDYVAKPIRPAILLARVHAQLELKQARDRLRHQNQWLEEEVNRRMAENDLIKEVTLNALASLTETRDNDTGHHLQRTQAYIEALMRHLQHQPRFAAELGPEQQRLILKAAPLHDIGKVGIPDAVLLKPGRLTDGERTTMQSHSQLGANALDRAIGNVLRVTADSGQGRESLAFLDMARQIALHHHEKWDGSGYPAGLKGEEIPLAARLMALADVFDALICDRPYRKALSMAETSAIICADRGTHFDPAIVDAFVALHDEFVAITNRFSASEPVATPEETPDDH